MTEINQVEISKDKIIQILEENIKSIEEKYEMLLASKDERLAEKDREIEFLREKILMLDSLKFNIPRDQMNTNSYQ